MIDMMFSIFNLLSSVDPQTQQLLNNLMEVLLPILYAIGGCGLAFSTIKYAFKIHSDPENKGEYLRHMVWSVLGCALILMSSGIAHIIFARMLGLL
ncbi:hypothetical protein [Spiroplasma endosymbiont of Danaus chrysippus]|uniref:hypothetical protein n=2 Tax=unclassified Spiroplasma TaxID=2637901 RepID=UPI00157A9BC8|nr:hypothetical protein [Spiroplasma endosymbiont of Danaus chrysippus]WDA54889.1 MAG: hypothetical protein PPFGHCPK_01370 [Spiroplasma endosymbiont of Drosophila atripex]